MSPALYGVVAVLVLLLALYAVLLYRKARCSQLGHHWQRTPVGYECTTCKAFVTNYNDTY